MYCHSLSLPDPLPVCIQVEERSETAERGVGARSGGGGGDGLYALDERVAGIDIDTCCPVGPERDPFLPRPTVVCNVQRWRRPAEHTESEAHRPEARRVR